MANLIITVISIALVAVAALMGAYYGSSAFMDGQAKAIAVQTQKQAEQIIAAANMWTLNNQRSFASAIGGYSVQSSIYHNSPTITNLLVSNYLSLMPKPDSNYLYGEWEISSNDNAGSSANPTIGYFLWAYISNPTTNLPNAQNIKICKEIAKIARGENAVPFLLSDWRAVHQTGMNPQIDCGWTYLNPVLPNIDACLTRAGSPTDNGCRVYVSFRLQ